uniref:non-specific serine/threonine protein kinase n=1 Tax=Magallana gigas TaxID=29159 RepID=K1PTH6_MAGGI
MATLTFDKEESFLRGHIPLQKFKKQIELLKWESVEVIDFAGNGYCTDQVIYTIRTAKRGAFSSLQRINLRGCQLLSDVGLSWLSDIIVGASKLVNVNLDGCCLVSDVGFARLLSVLPADCHLSVIGTAVCRLSAARDKKVRTGAGSAFPLDEGISDFKQGGVLVVPHSSVKSSIAHALGDKAGVSLTSLHHMTLGLKDGWTINLNEADINNPLLDILVGSKPVQVLIPFDGSADINDVYKHVTEVVSREPDYPYMEIGQHIDLFSQKVKTEDQFIEVKSVTGHKLDRENSVLENWAVTETERTVKGCFLSRTPLTRSHPYFLIEFIKKEESLPSDTEAADIQDELLIGAVRDVMIPKLSPDPNNNRSMISMTDPKNFVIHSFQLSNVKKGDMFGFGIHGDWDSEYNAGPHCRLYFTHNGTEVKYEGGHESQDGAFSRYYHPVVAINSHYTCQFKLPHLLTPPKELLSVYKKEKKWIHHGYNQCCVVNKSGVISQNKYDGRTSDVYFLSEPSIGTKDTPYTSFSFKILTEMDDFKIGIIVNGRTISTNHSDSIRYLLVVKEKNDKEILQLVNGPTKFTAGEEVTIEWEVERQPITFKGTKQYPIRVKRNGKLLCESSYNFNFCGGKPEEQVLVYIPSHNTQERRLQLMNYQPPYRAPIAESDKITVGVQRSMQIFDDGSVMASSDMKHSYAFLMSRTPINAQMTYFEMEVSVYGVDNPDMGIGLTHGFVDSSDYIGCSRYEVFYCSKNSARVGAVCSQERLITSEDLKFVEGDVLGCGVKGKFREDGELIEESEVEVYFTRNGEEVYRHKMKHYADGLFPFVAHSSHLSVIQIRGFSSGSDWNKAKFSSKGQKSSGASGSPFPGCGFTVLDVTGGANLAALKGKVTLDKLPCVQKIRDHIRTLEGESDSLGLDQQQRLSELVRASENLERLAKSPDRLTYLSAKLSSSEGMDTVKTAILNHFLSHRDQQMALYSLPSSLLKVPDLIRQEVRAHGICPVVESRSQDIACPSLFENIKSVSPKFLTGEMFLRLVEVMYHKGELLCLQSDCGLLAVDFDFAGKPAESLINFTKLESSPAGITAVGKSSTVWKAVLKDTDKDQMTLTFLQNYLGLMKIPVTWRTNVKDELFVYALTQNLSPPAQNFREFVSRERAVKDCVLLRRSYSFPAMFPPQLLPLILSAIVGYSRPIILSQEGTVTLSGVIQTIVKEGAVNGARTLEVECRCYLPQKNGASVNDDTERSVREYTRHVFCLVTDLVDRVIKRRGVLAVVSQNSPLNAVNSTVSCHHNWSPLPDTDSGQSVCTVCNLCCDKGENCVYNRLMGTDLRQCGCRTATPGCVDCGICVTCAKNLWNLRTELRPMAMSLTSASEIHQVTLSPVTFNEVEVDVTQGMCPPICLSSVNDGKCILTAPGMARTYNKDISLSDLTYAQNNNKDLRLYVKQGDRVKIRLFAPKGAVSSSAERGDSKPVVPTFIQYCTDVNREVLALQEAGIVCYAKGSKAVGQFVGPKPFSESLRKFSIKILCRGSKCSVGVGICPRLYPSNNMPGWKTNSYGYHADDGRVYKQNGSSKEEFEQCTIGDVMAVEYDVTTHELKFLKNEKEVHKMTIPDNGKKLPDFYPMIGLHSGHEVVRLMEVEPWTPLDPNAPGNYETLGGEIPRLPGLGDNSADPPKVLNMMKIYSGQCTGQIILHNTTKTAMGYKLEPHTIFVAREADGGANHSTGILEPNEVKVIMCHAAEQASKLSDITIQWKELQKDRKLKAVMLHADYHRGLNRVKKGDNRTDYILEVFKNSELMEQYWLGKDTYRLNMPFNCSQFILRYPKCPSFNFPSKLEKGMKVYISLPNKDVVEALISGVENSGKYLLEYSPEGGGDNKAISGDLSSMEVVGYKEGDPVLKFRADGECPQSLGGGGAGVLRTKPHWLSSLLVRSGRCNSDIHRPTVQEQLVVRHSRNLIGWLDGYGPRGGVEDTFTFLPARLTPGELLYPSTEMYRDLSVHRLCFYADQMVHFQSQRDLQLRNPVHLMDMPALTPKTPPSTDLTLTSKFQGWVYIALIAKKLLLASHKLILPEKDMESFSRPEIEHFLFATVQQFATLSSLLAAQYGGLPNQSNPTDGTKSVLQLIKGQDQSPIRYEGALVTDPHNLIQHGSLCICKAHKLAMATTDSDLQSDLELKDDLFAPYNENVNSVHLNINQEVDFPMTFFRTMPNLENFSLNGLSFKEKSGLSSEIANLEELRYIDIRYIKVTALPNSILRGISLKRVHFQGMPLGKVSSIMQRFNKTYRITELTLKDLNLADLPGEIKYLSQLSLGSSSVNVGYPLMNFDGGVQSLNRQQYRAWHKDNPAITNFLKVEVVESLFDEVDKNKKGVLGISEISQLNLKLFFLLPRFGTDGHNEKYGGWPEILFKMSWLRELNFGYQGITLVPTELKSMAKLEHVDLQYCPLLETLSSKLGLMNNLNGMDLRHSPSLRTPPHEVVGRGFPSVKAYLKRLDGGYTTCRRTKLMFVGLGEAGKTSLLKALTSNSKKTTGTQNAKLTDGIDIKSWKVKGPDGGEITYSAWDFAGQTVYYNTHQFFLTSRAVYLLLWNMRMGFEHAGLDFWLSSIACHAPDAPVLIVGTQLDQIEKPDFEEKIIRNMYPQIQGFHYVSSIDGRGIKELEAHLLEVTVQQSYLEEKIPQVWLNLEDKMIKMRKENAILDWGEVEKIAREEGIYHEQDLKEAVSFLDNLGTVQYFDTDFLRDKVVVDPQWIVNVMACVVSVRASVIQRNDGRFEHSQLDTVWEKFAPDLRPWLLSLTEEFDLTYPLPGQQLNIVPCLLPLEPPEEFQWPELDRLDDSVHENKIVYRFVYLPGGLFNRLQVRLFNFSDGKMIWKKGSFLQKNQHLALIQQDSDSQLTVTVQGPRPENILFLIHETLESLITESYHGVSYDFYIPSIMPDDRNSEFDIHLQSSISALQSINDYIEFDVAVLYCQADVPPKNKSDVINPRDIKKDLVAWNYNVWMPDRVSPDTASEMTLQFKNAKIVVCCISDQFEKDETCHDMFLYVANQLRKKVLVVVVRPSLAWQQTDLGMKIADALLCMIRTPDRYKTKIADLQGMIEKDLMEMEQNKRKPPEVFISYCWQNSKQAEAKNTVIKNRKSLGAYADSENCMMELKYAVKIFLMKLDGDPIILPMQDKDRRPELLEKVKEEEFELLQRKFLRHITMISTKLNFEIFPSLLVFDFAKAASMGTTSDSSKPQRPRTARERKKEDEEDWQGEEFCVKVLCEHEEGWHVSERSLSLSARSPEEVVKVIREAAPYLSRLYSVLKQSAVKLNCLRGKTGFVETDFGKAYEVIHHFVTDHASKRDLLQSLHRCHLPSGKLIWLCDNHSQGNRITKLSLGGTTSRGAGLVTLNREDEFLKEHMRRHPMVLKLLKRPEPEELEEEEEEAKDEEEAEDNEEERNMEEEQQEDSPEKGSPTEQETSVGIVVENRKEKEAVRSTADVKNTAEVKSSKEAVSVESKKDNVGTRLGGPVNRVGSPAPTRGGVEQRPGGKMAGKDPVKGGVQGGPKVGSDQKSPSTSGGQQNGDQTTNRGGQVKRPAGSPRNPQKKDANSSVCVLS